MGGFLKRFAIWSGVCLVSAAPSFLCGLSLHADPAHVAAMLAGIFTFVLAYAWVTGRPRFVRLKGRRFVRPTLYAGYGLRMLVTVLYPIGLFLDMMCGLISISLVEAVFGFGGMPGRSGGIESAGFAQVYITTLVQGAILNAVLVIFMLLLYGVLRLILGRRIPPEGCCQRCGYDLRASAGVCPECGLAIPEAAVRAGAAPPTAPPPRERELAEVGG